MNENLTKHVLSLLFLCLFLPPQANGQESYRDPSQPQLPKRAFVYWDGVNACKPSGTTDEETSQGIRWDGVNACKPSGTDKHRHVWEHHVLYMYKGEKEATTGTFEYQGEALARPFGIMATSGESAEKMADRFDEYLSDCKSEGTTPFVVFAPQLNIEGYLASLVSLPVVDLILARIPFIGQATGQKYVQDDIAWIREVAPIILSKLKEAGYEIDGAAHSWGVSLVVYALRAAREKDAAITLRQLLAMNGRKDRKSVILLETDGLVDSLAILTTSGDALTYWGKAAFGKGKIFIVRVDMDDWDTINPVKSMDVRHNAVLYADGDTEVEVEVNGVRYKMTLREVLFDLPNLFASPRGEKAIDEFLEKKRKKSNVRSTETKDEMGNPITGVEAGPVVAKMLVPALTGQIPWRGRAMLDMRGLLPTSGPPGTTRVGPLPVDHVLEMGNAVEAAANEFSSDRRFTATKAVVLLTKTPRVPYEHDYPICPRFHLKTLTNLAAVPLSLGGPGNSDAEDAWFWFSSFHDKKSGSVEVGCHFAVFVTEGNRDFTVDSRWVDKQYSPYWRDPRRRQYDYILNFQVWSYSASETLKLVRSVLEKLERLPGNWTITYANQEQPTQPTVFIEEAWLTGNTVYLAVWNRSWSPRLVCFHGTKQLQLGGRDLFFERWEPVYPGRTLLQLPLGSIHNAVIHCEVDGFIDKVFVSRDRLQAAPQPDASLTVNQRHTREATVPSIKILWPPADARVVTLQDQLDMPDNDDGKRLAINGICTGAADGSKVVVQIYTDKWYKHEGRRPEVKAGLWGVRAYLCGEGKHWIHATLYGPHGNKLATDQVGPIYRVEHCTGGSAGQTVAESGTEGHLRARQQKPQRIEIEAKDFRIQGGTRMRDGSVIVGGGPNGPHGREGSARCRIKLPQDVSSVEISICHGTPRQLGHGYHGKLGGKATVYVAGTPVHTMECKHIGMFGDWWPEPQPELGHTLPTVDLGTKGIAGQSVDIQIRVSAGTCMNLRSLSVTPIGR